MARKCAACSRVLRWDEHLTLTQYPDPVEGGTANRLACVDCRHKLAGFPAELPRVYPKGEPLPCKPGSDGDLPICAMPTCRRALFEDDNGEPIRLRAEDLDDGRWQAYTRVMTRPRLDLEVAATAAMQIYDEACQPHRQRLDGRMAELNTALETRLAQAEAAALTQEAFDAQAALTQEEHDAAVRLAGDEFEAATLGFRQTRDAALFRPGVAYRQAALASIANLPPPGPLPFEEGCYQSCRECIARWRPRVRERLIRQRIVKPDLPIGAMQGNLLL